MPAATATGFASNPAGRPADHEGGCNRAGAPSRAEQPRAFPAKLQRELDRLPDRIAAIEGEIKTVETALADPEFYARDAQAFAGASERLGDLRAQIASLEERWIELETQHEAEH